MVRRTSIVRGEQIPALYSPFTLRGRLMGTLAASTPTEAAFAAARGAGLRLALIPILAAAGIIAIGLFLSRLILRQLRPLVTSSRSLGRGALGVRAPVLSEESRRANFTNELGVDGTVRYLRNIMGLWLLQESLRAWGLDWEAVHALNPTAILLQISGFGGLLPGSDADRGSDRAGHWVASGGAQVDRQTARHQQEDVAERHADQKTRVAAPGPPEVELDGTAPAAHDEASRTCVAETQQPQSSRAGDDVDPLEVSARRLVEVDRDRAVAAGHRQFRELQASQRRDLPAGAQIEAQVEELRAMLTALAILREASPRSGRWRRACSASRLRARNGCDSGRSSSGPPATR